jgi:hypothetical protein
VGFVTVCEGVAEGEGDTCCAALSRMMASSAVHRVGRSCRSRSENISAWPATVAAGANPKRGKYKSGGSKRKRKQWREPRRSLRQAGVGLLVRPQVAAPGQEVLHESMDVISMLARSLLRRSLMCACMRSDTLSAWVCSKRDNSGRKGRFELQGTAAALPNSGLP